MPDNTGGHPLTHLGNTLLHLSLLGQCPTPQNCAPRHPDGEPLLTRERYRHLCLFLGGRGLPAQLMRGGSPVEGVGQAKGMRQRASERQGLADAGAGLIGKAKQPQGTSRIGAEKYPKVNAVAEDQRVMADRSSKAPFPPAPPPLRPSPPLGDRGPRAPEALLLGAKAPGDCPHP